MATAFDEIRFRLGQTTPPPAPPVTTQAELQRIGAAVATGRARADGGVPVASALGAQAVDAQVAAQKRQQELQGAFQAESFRQQENQNIQRMEFRQKQLAQGRQLAIERTDAQTRLKINDLSNRASNRLRELGQQFGLEKGRILNIFERKAQNLEDRADHAQLEQMGFLLALEDKETLANLEEIGKIRLLSNSLRFKEESLRLSLGAREESVIERLGLKDDLLRSDLDLADRMSELGLQDLEDILSSTREAQQTQAIIEGGTVLVGEAAKFAAREEAAAETPGEIEAVGVPLTQTKEPEFQEALA